MPKQIIINKIRLFKFSIKVYIMVMSVTPDPQQHAALVYCCFAVFHFNKVYLKIGNLQS